MFKKIIEKLKAYQQQERLHREFQEACRIDPRFIQEFAAIQAREEQLKNK